MEAKMETGRPYFDTTGSCRLRARPRLHRCRRRHRDLRPLLIAQRRHCQQLQCRRQMEREMVIERPPLGAVCLRSNRLGSYTGYRSQRKHQAQNQLGDDPTGKNMAGSASDSRHHSSHASVLSAPTYFDFDSFFSLLMLRSSLQQAHSSDEMPVRYRYNCGFRRNSS